MDFGASIFTTDYSIEPTRLARELEARGFESMWAPEHSHIPTSRRSPWPGGGELPKPYYDCYDPFVVLSAAAAVTSKIKLGTGVCLVIQRDTIQTAKLVASLDRVSNGRFLFGIGGGWNAEEMEDHGTVFATRFKKMREQCEAMIEIWTKSKPKFESEFVKFPEMMAWPKPVQKPHPPMWVAATQPATLEFAGSHGLGVLGFGIGQGQSNEYVRLYRDRIKQCDPIGSFINNKFALLTFTLCCDTDEEALAIQGPNFRMYNEAVRNLFAPWIDGKPPRSYEFFMKHWLETMYLTHSVPVSEIVKAGGACIGSPETCLNVIQYLSDAGVDEALLFMQMYTTPHDKIMRSIQLIADKVMPKLK